MLTQINMGQNTPNVRVTRNVDQSTASMIITPTPSANHDSGNFVRERLIKEEEYVYGILIMKSIPHSSGSLLPSCVDSSEINIHLGLLE